MDLQLIDRVVLVTGGYRGTGAGIARVLADEGAIVLVHGFEAGQPDAVVGEITGAGGSAFAVLGDPRTEPGADALAAACAAAVGDPVTILVNNYGVAEGGRWWESHPADWIDSYEKNVLSGVRMVHRLVPAMRERGWGRVVFVSTVGATRPGDRLPHYYAAKGALPSVTVSLAKELAGSGVTVNCVSPGVIATPDYVEGWTRQAEREGRSTEWADVERHVLAQGSGNYTGRIADVSEVGALVAFVCSPLAAQIDGAHLRIDGGAADCVT